MTEPHDGISIELIDGDTRLRLSPTALLLAILHSLGDAANLRGPERIGRVFETAKTMQTAWDEKRAAGEQISIEIRAHRVTPAGLIVPPGSPGVRS